MDRRQLGGMDRRQLGGTLWDFRVPVRCAVTIGDPRNVPGVFEAFLCEEGYKRPPPLERGRIITPTKVGTAEQPPTADDYLALFEITTAKKWTRGDRPMLSRLNLRLQLSLKRAIELNFLTAAQSILDLVAVVGVVSPYSNSESVCALMDREPPAGELHPYAELKTMMDAGRFVFIRMGLADPAEYLPAPLHDNLGTCASILATIPECLPEGTAAVFNRFMKPMWALLPDVFALWLADPRVTRAVLVHTDEDGQGLSLFAYACQWDFMAVCSMKENKWEKSASHKAVATALGTSGKVLPGDIAYSTTAKYTVNKYRGFTAMHIAVQTLQPDVLKYWKQHFPAEFAATLLVKAGPKGPTPYRTAWRMEGTLLRYLMSAHSMMTAKQSTMPGNWRARSASCLLPSDRSSSIS